VLGFAFSLSSFFAIAPNAGSYGKCGIVIGRDAFAVSETRMAQHPILSLFFLTPGLCMHVLLLLFLSFFSPKFASLSHEAFILPAMIVLNKHLMAKE
jgi:hypothetical protein